MNQYSNFENLLNHFSEKIKFNVIDVYASECFILMLVKPKRVYKKGNVNHLWEYINLLVSKLTKFTGLRFCIIIDFKMYISVVGNLLISGCTRKPTILSLRPRRKK